jgi:FkbM family methyltransferase
MSVVMSSSRLAKFANLSCKLLCTDYSWQRKLLLWKTFFALSLHRTHARHDGKMAGFKVSYFNSRDVLALYHEIFIQRPYYFPIDNPEPVIFDCGANIGIATLFFKFMYPKSRVQSFEPDPRTFSLLRRNVVENGLQDVTVHEVALWDKETFVDFYVETDKPGDLMMSTNGHRTSAGAIQVRAAPLSSFIDETVDFLKLDVEGAEGRVLRDLAESGKLRRIRQMVIEYHHKIPGDASALGSFLSILEDHGFEYQLSAECNPIARREVFQDMMIYAYSRENR